MAKTLTPDEAWNHEVRSLDELVQLTKALQTAVKATGAARGQARARAIEGCKGMREAVVCSLQAETATFESYADAVTQPDLFDDPPKKDGKRGRRKGAETVQ